jgi:phosphohistidine swiveling domain-containing protein
VRVLSSIDDMHWFVPGEVLVADMTDPDWEPIMKRASAIVTNRGGRTCHAAIIARELGIPAAVGTGAATRELPDGQSVTVSCAEGDTGYIYDGILDFTVESTDLGAMPDIPVKIMMNVGTPNQAFAFSRRRMPVSDWHGLSSSSIARSGSIPRRCCSWTVFKNLCDVRSLRLSRPIPVRGTISSLASQKASRPWPLLRARAGHRTDVGLQVQ